MHHLHLLLMPVGVSGPLFNITPLANQCEFLAPPVLRHITLRQPDFVDISLVLGPILYVLVDERRHIELRITRFDSSRCRPDVTVKNSEPIAQSDLLVLWHKTMCPRNSLRLWCFAPILWFRILFIILFSKLIADHKMLLPNSELLNALAGN